MAINDFALQCAVPGVRFGGVGQSGSGAYHGKAGFDTFTHHRTITRSRLPLSMGQLITPPYSPRVQRALRRYIDFSGRKAAARSTRD